MAKKHQPTGDSGKASPKRDAILKAATRVFLESGYGAAGMDAIAREAGVAKQTIYSHFGAKDALFGAIIRDKCGRLMPAVTTTAAADKLHGDDHEEVLLGIAGQFLELVMAEESLATFRVVIAESARFPELAEAFYRSGPKQAAENLAVYLADLDGSGILGVADPLGSARLFFAMLRGDLYLRRLLGMAAATAPGEMEAAARQAVKAFLAAHAPKK
ncbi:MAG: hypothetical protein A3G18_12735 [Rhodospirillales bacterium RIFCSPLOWO2_12_FULL_58_28]|nr:MAG: hypothetical protein A3H92_10140 [Rhodospirillales bacterium RIFCSPLOWO2_02_FULL_58_16]OHC77133.1 MAG: hypothetical protein A3G18_12735 [Rhodospirillales bacterium RIFCSPLOWO2_12_FULL_58_28]